MDLHVLATVTLNEMRFNVVDSRIAAADPVALVGQKCHIIL